MQAENTKTNIKTLTFGCRLNSLESEKIADMLSPCMSGAIVVNTCAVTAEAERQSGQAVRKIARENPNMPIFVTGCAATRNPQLFNEIPNTVTIPNAVKMQLQSYLDALSAHPCNINVARPFSFDRPAPNMSKQFIQVQNGCNHKCAYCVTRLLRGPAVSFEYDTILRDAHAAIRAGFGEIVLTGVDIASYARDGALISDICHKLLNDVPGIRRLRLSSMDPASPQIFKIMDMIAADARMMPHMHLSMQSGSDTILKSMGRRHNADLVRRIAEYGVARGITFSWDIICGFPGETDELWLETMDLVRATRPIRIHAFPFSPRPGTPAADMPDQVNRAISKARVHEINELATKNRDEFMRAQIGKTVQVLVESNNNAREIHDMPVKIIGEHVPERTICNAVLTDISGDEFIGEIK